MAFAAATTTTATAAAAAATGLVTGTAAAVAATALTTATLAAALLGGLIGTGDDGGVVKAFEPELGNLGADETLDVADVGGNGRHQGVH